MPGRPASSDGTAGAETRETRPGVCSDVSGEEARDTKQERGREVEVRRGGVGGEGDRGEHRILMLLPASS